MGKRAPYKGRDRFGERARDEGYAARSVYKLDEIDRRFKLLRAGERVVDLGCHPGSWSRYVVKQIGDRGTLVGVDIEDTALPGATFFKRSVLDVTAEQLREVLQGPADVVLSDMAPRTTGNKLGDHVRQLELARCALDIAVTLLAPGGAFVVKVFDGEDSKQFELDVRRHFAALKRVRPEAVRRESREFFLVGQGFVEDARF